MKLQDSILVEVQGIVIMAYTTLHLPSGTCTREKKQFNSNNVHIKQYPVFVLCLIFICAEQLRSI